MRIGIDTRLVYYTRAGIGEYTLRLVQALAMTYTEARFVLLQDRRNPRPLIEAPNVDVVTSFIPSHHRAEQLLLPFTVNGLPVDVFHSPHQRRRALLRTDRSRSEPR